MSIFRAISSQKHSKSSVCPPFRYSPETPPRLPRDPPETLIRLCVEGSDIGPSPFLVCGRGVSCVFSICTVVFRPSHRYPPCLVFVLLCPGLYYMMRGTTSFVLHVCLRPSNHTLVNCVKVKHPPAFQNPTNQPRQKTSAQFRMPPCPASTFLL